MHTTIYLTHLGISARRYPISLSFLRISVPMCLLTRSALQHKAPLPLHLDQRDQKALAIIMNRSNEKHNTSMQQPPIEEKGDVFEVAATYTPEEEGRVLRKIDCYVLPLMCIVFFMQVSSRVMKATEGLLTLTSTWTNKVLATHL